MESHIEYIHGIRIRSGAENDTLSKNVVDSLSGMISIPEDVFISVQTWKSKWKTCYFPLIFPHSTATDIRGNESCNIQEINR